MSLPCLICASENRELIGGKDSYSIFKCRDCDLRFLDPIPNQQILNDFYNNQSNVTHYVNVIPRKLKSGRRKIKKLIKYCPKESTVNTRKFLDIGCNTGANVEAARRLGFKATGIDLSESAIESAKQNFPNNRFEVKTILELAEEKILYDLIFCTEVIEHISEIHNFVESLKNLLSTEGILYLTTPDAGHFRVPRNFSSWKHVHAPDHICYFNRGVLKRLFTKHGMKVIKFKWSLRTTIQALLSQ